MNTIGKALGLLALIAVGVTGLPAARAADAVLEQARQLMAKPDARAAYELLSPLEAQRAGDPDFDYLLGIAALDAGQPTRAVFALERVLAVTPGHAQARAEIARAYFLLGETGAAKQEFEAVKSSRPPPEAAATIDRFLDAINRLADADRTRFAGYIEATIGHDTNVNSGPAGSQVAVPAFGGLVVTLSPGGVKARDDFGSIAAGVSVRHPLAKDVALVAGLNATKRVNSTEDTFDTGYWDGNVGVAWTRGNDVFTAAVQGNNFYLDNNRYRDAYGVIGQWQHNLDARNQVSAFAQYTQLRYADRPGLQNSLRDADRTVGGIAYAHAFSDSGSVVYGGAYLGTEDQREGSRPDLGHHLHGVRFGGQQPFGEKVLASLSGSVERRNYGGQDAAFLTTRGDTQYDMVLRVTYSPFKDWKIIPQIAVTRNRSSLPINDYRREIYSITLRREL